LISQGVPPLGGIKQGSGEKTILCVMTDRKSYVGFRLTPRSMTLDDLELL